MSKPKFDPVVTRIKLNPEQAVLACLCWSARRRGATATNSRAVVVCRTNVSPRRAMCNRTTSANAAIS
jgi:hypothetical protein